MSTASSLGAYLRQRRERAGLSVEAIASASRIGPQFVRALERDRHDALPAPVYVRGFIRAYCHAVGADPEEALRRYDARPGAPPRPALRPPPPLPPRPLPARHRRLAVLGAVLLVTLALAVTFFLTRAPAPGPGTAIRPETPGAPAPAVAPRGPWVGPLPAGPRAAPAAPGSPAAPPAPIPAAPPARAPEARDRVLQVRAMDTAWVRVAPEGGPATEVTLPPGAVREWRSAGRFRVTLGNAGAVELALDGQRLPGVGQRGEVVHRTIPEDSRP